MRCLALLLVVFLLSGCNALDTLSKVTKVVMNPDLQVGSDQDKPSQVTFNLVAEPDVNQDEAENNGNSSSDDQIGADDDNDNTDEDENSTDNETGNTDNRNTSAENRVVDQQDKDDEDRGSPVQLQIVMLAEDSQFLATDYDQVTENIEKALGKNYLDHQDYTLLPGQFKYLPPISLDRKVHYIGVIVHYADSEAAEWRRVVRVKNTGRSYQMLVHLYASEVELKVEEE